MYRVRGAWSIGAEGRAILRPGGQRVHRPAQHGPYSADVRALRGPVALDGLVWPVVGT